MGLRSHWLLILLVHAIEVALAGWEGSLPPGFIKTGPVTYVKAGPLPPGYIKAGPAFFQKPSELGGTLPRTMPVPIAVRPADLAIRRGRVSPFTAKHVTPNNKVVLDSVSTETRKALKDRCTSLDSGTVVPASVVLKSISKGSLKHLMPSKSEIFVHKGLNKATCSALGGHCVSNFTLIKSVDEFTSKFSWKKCAVVGNSGSLLASRYGAAIDSHDVVVRMNIAPVSGKELYVGKKTSVRMINSKWVRLYSQGSSMVGVGPKTTLLVRVVDQSRWFSLLHRYMSRRRPDVNVILLNTHNVRAATRLLEAYRLCYQYNGRKFDGGTIPSSGFVLALSLTQLCDQVNVYGFGRPKFQGRLVPYQYYIERNADGSINNGSPNHAFTMENTVLREIARDSPKINFCGIDEASSAPCNSAST
eukprot:CAMPEP_0118940240 /NCGR_PEP_ID=MMETSP1169-20130426/30918_1 /TAXON_ID=36882 /ORGANISM="Pyramimonas obovata, Strain CCMP722" /LENGTH=416 /DNA_ID=CAMNT_0006884677 /DNA_START=84 /DNA_END=1334 /DNA_ORIENTATION=-